MTLHSRWVRAAVGLLLLSVLLSACGAAPVAETWPGLTLEGDTLYVVSGAPQKVFLLDAETGVQKQTFMPQGVDNGLFYWSAVTLGGGQAFVGFANATSGLAGLYAFDPATGQELWHVPTDDLILPAPVYADGVVYFGNSNGEIFAVDAESHLVKPGWPFQAQEAIWASPLVIGDRLYLAAMDHHLYCLDAETGQEIWSTRLGGAMAVTPALDEARGILYVGAFDGRVYAVDADTGEPVEGFDFRAGNWIWSEVLLDDGRLYVTSLDGRLYALDPVTGQVVAGYPYNAGEIDGTNTAVRTAPVQAGDNVIVGTETGRVIAVQNGQRRWSWPGGVPQAAVYTTPVVDEGRVFIVLMDGQVQSLDASNGAPRWSFAPPAAD